MNKEKSGRIAHYGHTSMEEKEENVEVGSNNNGDLEQRQPPVAKNMAHLSWNSSDTRVGSVDVHRNAASDVAADPEKGRYISLIHWYSEGDPEVWVGRAPYLGF